MSEKTIKKSQITNAINRVLFACKWYTPEVLLRASRASNLVSTASNELLSSIEPNLTKYQKFKLKVLQIGGLPLLVILLYGDMAAMSAVSSIFSDHFGGKFEYYFTAIRSIKYFILDSTPNNLQLEVVPLSLLYGILIDKNNDDFENLLGGENEIIKHIGKVLSFF